MREINRILIVNFHEINKLPPVKNLIDVLIRNEYSVSVITFDNAGLRKLYEQNNSVKFYVLKEKMGKNKIISASEFVFRKKRLREKVSSLMEEHDVLWTTTDRTVRELGKEVYKYKHVMQLMELIEDIPLIPNQNCMMSHLDRYARKAYKVVVPEYNRAHIQKTWWNLDNLPIVLPNKPAELDFKNIPENISEYIQKLKGYNKKIILYQGVIRKERPLQYILDAIEEKKDEYLFCVMGADENNEIKYLEQKYECLIHVPFIKPPYHLLITKMAYVGVLTYIPYYDPRLHQSELNALYCAPNKIFEYCAFGIPMIGNDVPGIFYPLLINQIGTCYKNMSKEEVLKALIYIEKDYLNIHQNCLKYFKKIDLDKIICKEILGEK